MSEISRILDELQREHDGDPWHGSPLMSILQGIDARQAATKPFPEGHSVWELVLHMTGWKLEVAKRAAGGPASDPEQGDWPAVGDPTPARWKAACDRLADAHRKLVDAIAALPESKLHEPTNDPRNRALGTGVSYYVLLHGIVQHDVYHAGQIALIKKNF
jgi:uncharacterized damage-inducible protein DinB